MIPSHDALPLHRPQTNETRMSKALGQSDSFLFVGQLSQRFATESWPAQWVYNRLGFLVFLVFWGFFFSVLMWLAGGMGRATSEPVPCFYSPPPHDTIWTITIVSGQPWLMLTVKMCPFSLLSLPTKFLTLWAFENRAILHLWHLSTTKPACPPPGLVYPRKTLPL